MKQCVIIHPDIWTFLKPRYEEWKKGGEKSVDKIEILEPYPKAGDDPIRCQCCGEWRPRYKPYNVCCEDCNRQVTELTERFNQRE